MAGFAMAENTDEFYTVTSSLLDEVVRCFDHMCADREYDPIEDFLPYLVEKSVIYLCNDLTGYEYEIAMSAVRPGYIIQVAVRHNPNFSGQTKLQRQLNFYEQSLRTRRQEDEAVVMAGESEDYEHDDTILAPGIVRHVGIVPAPENPQLYEAIERSTFLLDDMQQYIIIRRWTHLFFGSSHERNEANLLKQLKFIAYTINLELNLKSERDLSS